MGSPDTIHFSKAVKPNDTIDVTLSFTAPSNTGANKSSWWLQNSEGVNFFPFFITIQVVSAAPTATKAVPTKTATLQPSLTVAATTP